MIPTGIHKGYFPDSLFLIKIFVFSQVRSVERASSAAGRESAGKRPCHAAQLGPLDSPRSSRHRRVTVDGSSMAWWLGPTALAGESFHQDFTLVEGRKGMLGRGTFGSVHRCAASAMTVL